MMKLKKNESYSIGDFKIILEDDGTLKISAVLNVHKDNIRTYPISSNNIRVESYDIKKGGH